MTKASEFLLLVNLDIVLPSYFVSTAELAQARSSMHTIHVTVTQSARVCKRSRQNPCRIHQQGTNFLPHRCGYPSTSSHGPRSALHCPDAAQPRNMLTVISL